MCTFIFSYPKSGSKCLRKVQHFLLPPQKARVARVPRIKCYPCFRAGAIHEICTRNMLGTTFVSHTQPWKTPWIAPARGSKGSEGSPDFAEKLTRGVKNPKHFLNRSSLALCHYQLELLRPFLSTLRSDESISDVDIFENAF